MPNEAAAALTVRLAQLQERAQESGPFAPGAVLLAALRGSSFAGEPGRTLEHAFDELDRLEGQRLLAAAGTSAAEIAQRIAAPLRTQLVAVPRGSLRSFFVDPLDHAVGELVARGERAMGALVDLLREQFLDFLSPPRTSILGGAGHAQHYGPRPSVPTETPIQLIARDDIPGLAGAKSLPGHLLDSPRIREEDDGVYLTAGVRTAEPLLVSERHFWSFFLVLERRAKDQAPLVLSTTALRVSPDPDAGGNHDDRRHLEARFRIRIDGWNSVGGLELPSSGYTFALSARSQDR